MTDFPDMLVLRHGETEWNRMGRIQGNQDSALTDLGRWQAQQQGEILAGFGIDGWHWVSSPRGRALTTAQLASGREVIDTDSRLVEIDVGDWTGATRARIRAARPDLAGKGPLAWYDNAPGGEGIATLAARVGAFLGALSGPTVIVTHGITSRILRCLATGQSFGNYAGVSGGQGVVYHLKGGVSRLLVPARCPSAHQPLSKPCIPR
ncbi:MAG: histidine phosphatase family protein [Rhodobacteraceae bacterium]|nr:histidine phosphatase family protein [Paracoccaceae bacterium]